MYEADIRGCHQSAKVLVSDLHNHLVEHRQVFLLASIQPQSLNDADLPVFHAIEGVGGCARAFGNRRAYYPAHCCGGGEADDNASGPGTGDLVFEYRAELLLEIGGRLD